MKSLLIYLLIGLIIDIIFIITVRISNSVLHTNILEDFIYETKESAIPTIIISLPIIYPIVLMFVLVAELTILFTNFCESKKIINFFNKLIGIKKE